MHAQKRHHAINVQAPAAGQTAPDTLALAQTRSDFFQKLRCGKIRR
jgi:hypothetical protein